MIEERRRRAAPRGAGAAAEPVVYEARRAGDCQELVATVPCVGTRRPRESASLIAEPRFRRGAWRSASSSRRTRPRQEEGTLCPPTRWTPEVVLRLSLSRVDADRGAPRSLRIAGGIGRQLRGGRCPRKAIDPGRPELGCSMEAGISAPDGRDEDQFRTVAFNPVAPTPASAQPVSARWCRGALSGRSVGNLAPDAASVDPSRAEDPSHVLASDPRG